MNDSQAMQISNANNYQGGQTIAMDNCTGGYVQTTGNIQFWPYTTIPNYWPTWTGHTVIYTNAPPTECAGDVHVFACQKCGECKCGKARMAKAKK